MWIYKRMVHCENCFEITRGKWAISSVFLHSVLQSININKHYSFPPSQINGAAEPPLRLSQLLHSHTMGDVGRTKTSLSGVLPKKNQSFIMWITFLCGNTGHTWHEIYCTLQVLSLHLYFISVSVLNVLFWGLVSNVRGYITILRAGGFFFVQ